MAQLRPDLVGAVRKAAAAVEADTAERARLKAQKKAEAAERRRLHTEAVAHRRATDIVFLGRGVSGGLSDRRSLVERLAERGLPLLSTPADLAAASGLTIPRCAGSPSTATPPPSPTTSGSPSRKERRPARTGLAPCRDGRCQRWIKLNILDKVPLRDSAHGFVTGRSILTNAKPHVARDVVVNADLKDFFPSITFPRVKGIFQELGYSPAASTILGLLCTESPRKLVRMGGRELHVACGPRALPQGACTSPALSNLASRALDGRLLGLAAKHGWTYTRYADDLTFSTSGDPAQKTAWILACLRHIAQDESFAVNEKKTRVQRQNSQQTVTGVVVNKHPNIPRDTVRRLRAILHPRPNRGPGGTEPRRPSPLRLLARRHDLLRFDGEPGAAAGRSKRSLMRCWGERSGGSNVPSLG